MAKRILHPKIVVGEKRHKLTVVEDRGTDEHGNRWWFCRCDCGTEKAISQCSLRVGQQSCGCERTRLLVKRKTTHGQSKCPEYKVWAEMLGRCINPKNQRYPLYGARGITVCDRWQGDGGWVHFIADMGFRPTPKHELDRIDNDGPYSPNNCRWTTHRVQMNNTRRTVFLTVDGVKKSLAMWCEELGLIRSTVHRRLKDGWSHQRALTPSRPIKRRNP